MLNSVTGLLIGWQSGTSQSKTLLENSHQWWVTHLCRFTVFHYIPSLPSVFPHVTKIQPHSRRFAQLFQTLTVPTISFQRALCNILHWLETVQIQFFDYIPIQVLFKNVSISQCHYHLFIVMETHNVMIKFFTWKIQASFFSNWKYQHSIQMVAKAYHASCNINCKTSSTHGSQFKERIGWSQICRVYNYKFETL